MSSGTVKKLPFYQRLQPAQGLKVEMEEKTVTFSFPDKALLFVAVILLFFYQPMWTFEARHCDLVLCFSADQ